MEKSTHIVIESPTAEDNPHRLEHVFPVSDQGLEEGFKRALEKTCCEEIPVYKKQKQKTESWAFHEPPAMVVKPPPSTMKSSTSKKAISSSALAGLTGDNRRAKISQMLQEATVITHAAGKLDPEPELHPNGRRRLQRCNAFVVHHNRNSTGMFPAVAPSTANSTRPFNGLRNENNAVLGLPPRESNMFFRRSRNSTGMFPAVASSTANITRPFNGIRNEKNAVLGLPPRESNMFFRRRSLSWSHSLNESNHSTPNSSPNTKH
jgi:hypothetical protein